MSPDGGVFAFGDGDEAPVIAVTMRDVRSSMVNLDPNSASPAPEVPKAVVRANQNNAEGIVVASLDHGVSPPELLPPARSAARNCLAY